MLEPTRLDKLLRGLDSCLQDCLLVIADHLEEEGQTGLADAYRKLARMDVVPLRYSDRWHWRRPYASPLPLGHQLPKFLNEAMQVSRVRIGLEPHEFRSLSEAFRAAAGWVVLTGYDPDAIPF